MHRELYITHSRATPDKYGFRRITLYCRIKSRRAERPSDDSRFLVKTDHLRYNRRNDETLRKNEHELRNRLINHNVECFHSRKRLKINRALWFERSIFFTFSRPWDNRNQISCAGCYGPNDRASKCKRVAENNQYSIL